MLGTRPPWQRSLVFKHSFLAFGGTIHPDADDLKITDTLNSFCAEKFSEMYVGVRSLYIKLDTVRLSQEILEF